MLIHFLSQSLACIAVALFFLILFEDIFITAKEKNGEGKNGEGKKRRRKKTAKGKKEK
jgi:hypothetical protein